jgi:hypothetical protein
MSGARVAEYLRGEAEQKPVGDRILERLTAAQPTQPAATASATPAPAVDQHKLDELTKATEPSPAPAPMADTAKTAELEKANEKLASLLNKSK